MYRYNKSDYYYNRLKKFSCLRALNKSGFDIKEFYSENPLNKDHQKINQNFDNLTVKEIFDSIKKKLSNLEKDYVTSTINETGTAADGLRDLIKSFKIRPEIGPELQGIIYNSVVQGARKGKYYLRSAGSGVGKSRLAVGDACSLSIPFYYDWEKDMWIDRGHSEKILFITTEMDRDEVQSMLVACISGVNEKKILHGDYGFKEERIIDEAISIVEAFKDNFILDKIPDPSIGQVEACVRNHVLVDGVQDVFHDYIFSAPSLFAEFAKFDIRQDVLLLMLSTALKDLATELGIFMASATQLSGDYKNQRGVRDQSFLRDSKAIADKADVGSIVVRIGTEEKAIIEPICQQLGLPIPTHVTDVYKNRRSDYTQVKIWSRIDLGTCREQDILITNGFYEIIEDFELIKYNYTGTYEIPDFIKSEEIKQQENNKEIEEKEKESENMVIKIEDIKEPIEELPPFSGPVNIIDKTSGESTYIENPIDFQEKAVKKKSNKKGRLAALLYD